MSKQTAVEWLIEQLTPSISLQQKHIDDLKEKAKEMEKQQILDAWIATDNELQRMAAEKYYNKTYESKGSGMSEKPNDHIVDTNKMICEHQYSRTINQSYRRKCLKCKEVEGGNNEF